MTGHDDREWFGREPARPDETAYLEEQQERHRPAPKPKPDPVPAEAVEAAIKDVIVRMDEYSFEAVAEQIVAVLREHPERLLAMALTKEELVFVLEALSEKKAPVGTLTLNTGIQSKVMAAYLEGENASRSQEQRHG